MCLNGSEKLIVLSLKIILKYDYDDIKTFSETEII